MCFVEFIREAPPHLFLNDNHWLTHHFGMNSTRPFRYYCETEGPAIKSWFRDASFVTNRYVVAIHAPSYGVYQCVLAWEEQPDVFYAYHYALLYVQFQCK